MVPVILNALVPIFFVLALGYLAGRLKRVDNAHVNSLNTLVMEYALPASLLAATWHTPRLTLLGQWPLVVVLSLGMLLIYAVAYGLQRRVFRLGVQEAAVQALTVALPNYAAAGLPLVLAVFGPSQVVLVAVSIACGSIVVSPLTLVLLEIGKPGGGGGSVLGHVWTALRQAVVKPIVSAPLAGVVLSFAGVPLPAVLGNSLDLIGRASGGVALFLTGLILSAQPFKLDANVLSGALLKNVLHPLVAVLLVRLLPMGPEPARAAVLLSAIPSGFFGVLFGLPYGVASREAGSTLTASNVLGILTIAAVIYLTHP